MESGDFTFGGQTSPKPLTIYDPATEVLNGTTWTSSPFPGNIIPQNRFDPAGMPATDADAKKLRAHIQTLTEMQPSSTDTDLYKALASQAQAEFHAPVTPYLFQAGTDAAAWRSRGIPVYGIYPYPVSPDDMKRMHGNDERISVHSLDQGTEMIYKTILQLAAK
jgi:hypothetical protein